jgi:hypothetical protein
MELNCSPPQLWYTLLQTTFGVENTDLEILGNRLWEFLPNVHEIRWQLALVENRGGRRRVTDGLSERVHRLSLVLSPQVLLYASTRAWPEGNPRPLNVRRFEAAVLDRTKEGKWRL